MLSAMNHITSVLPRRAIYSQQNISFIPLPSWIKAATRCGFAIYPVLKELGVNISESSPNGITLSVDQSKLLVVACTARARGEHFPFAFGDCFAIDAVPEMDNFLATSSTLREAIKVFDWVQQLVSPALGVSLYEESDLAQLRIQMDRLATRSPATVYYTEAVITWIFRDMRTLFGKQHATRILFRHPAPAYYKMYKEFFGVEVKFDQMYDAIELPRKLLNKKLHGAFPELHKQAESRLRRRVAQMPSRVGISGQLERMFSISPTLFSHGMDKLAIALKLPVRTLQRRLQAEGQSFAKLQAGARFRLACSLLKETSLDLETVSERLGFSERRAFTRAFKKWSGQSPSAYQQHVK